MAAERQQNEYKKDTVVDQIWVYGALQHCVPTAGWQGSPALELVEHAVLQQNHE